MRWKTKQKTFFRVHGQPLSRLNDVLKTPKCHIEIHIQSMELIPKNEFYSMSFPLKILSNNQYDTNISTDIWTDAPTNQELLHRFIDSGLSSPPILSDGGHVLEGGRPDAAALRLQPPVPHRREEEGGERCAVLLALRALRGIPLSGGKPGFGVVHSGQPHSACSLACSLWVA